MAMLLISLTLVTVETTEMLLSQVST